MITVVMYHQEVYLNTIFSDEALLTVIGAGGSELPETGDDTNLPLYIHRYPAQECHSNGGHRCADRRRVADADHLPGR